MNATIFRENWNGHPVELGDAWTLHKGEKTARCFLMSHLFGWELRLVAMPDDFLRSQVVPVLRRSPEHPRAVEGGHDRKGLAMKLRRPKRERQVSSPSHMVAPPVSLRRS
jgi:hypothetical protein